MKKLVVLLLLLVSTNVMSEWTAVSGSADGSTTVYVDFETIKRKGNKVMMWSLFDYKTVRIYAVDNTRYLSSLSRYEYDCEEETIRALDLHWYSGNMKTGDNVFSNTNIQNQSTSIRPDTIEEVVFKIACSKK